MTFDAIPSGTAVFLDANPFLHYFTAHPKYGLAAERLIDRIENRDLVGFTSAHVLLEVVHRLMTIEACQRFPWPVKGIAHRLRKHPAQVQQLAQPRQAFDEISLLGLTVLPVASSHVSVALDVSRQAGLLSADATIIAVMQQHGLSHLASNDPDFNRVPGIMRYAPA
jgi:predicted nucleic acid-binding protein